MAESIFTFPDAVGKAGARRAQSGDAWPEGTVVVDCDAHWMEPDVYYKRLPEELKSRAPRLQWEGDEWQVRDAEGRALYPSETALRRGGTLKGIPGFQDPDKRLEDMDIEGIGKQLIFPEELFGLYFRQEGSVEMREEVFRAYNESVSAMCATAPGRLYFVAVANYFDPSKAKDSVEEAKRLGASAVIVPTNPRKDVDGEPIQLASPKMDAFWSAVSDSGLPVCFHVGEGFAKSAPGELGGYILTQLGGFRTLWGTLVYGGVFDRHPKLKAVFLEAGINWVAGMLYDADHIYQAFPNELARLDHVPSWYWHNHCYSTLSADDLGLELIDRIGVDRVMWSSDYPHNEGTFGYTRDAIQKIFDAVPVEDAQKIVGQNALNLFNMN